MMLPDFPCTHFMEGGVNPRIQNLLRSRRFSSVFLPGTAGQEAWSHNPAGYHALTESATSTRSQAFPWRI